jgi:hypothetical protein
MEPVQFPDVISDISLEDLEALEARAVEAFQEIRTQDVTVERVTELARLQAGLARVRVELTGRRAAAAADEANHQAELEAQAKLLAARVNGEPEPDGGNGGGEGAPAPAGVVDIEAITQAAAAGATQALVAALGARRFGGAIVTDRPRDPSLAGAREHAPAVVPPPRSSMAVTDVNGNAITDMTAIGDAATRTAQSCPITANGTGARTKFATIKREYAHVLDMRNKLSEVGDIIDELTSGDRKDALLAGGGWCAPSEIRYDFFNIADTGTPVDLPTVGISRGGIRFPTSPSLADAVYTVGGVAGQNLAGFGKAFDSASMPWLWLETDDIATVTGTPNKPTMRVPCPSFGEVRLEGYGIQMTAGNLTDDAYPEATQNTLKLLMTAWARAKNLRIIQQMVSLCSPAASGSFIGAGTNQPAFNQICSGLSLAAVDYRARFGMADEAVLECVLPQWVPEVIAADLARRNTNSDALLSTTEAQIVSYFRDRYIRVQFVSDWQSRTTGTPGAPASVLLNWPASVQAILYAAGTFLLGNGLTLDLGVIRDSVLNAENDYTAAFSEEAHLVAKVGHEARLYTITYSVVGGAPGALALGNLL